jgi:nitrous oxidase accessory protein NosD
MGIIEGGVVIQDGVPRHVNPFGAVRHVRSGETLQTAIVDAAAGDVIYVDPGEYDEEITITKSNITVVAVGGRGAVAIAPSAADPVAVTIDGSAARRTDVTLVNLGLEGDGTGGGLHIKGDVRRVRVYGCKIEGGAFGAKLESTAAGALADNRFEGCEFAFTTTAVHIDVSGGGDPVTQTLIRNSLLHNFSGRGVFVDTTHTADLWLEDNVFAAQEDGTAPSDEWIKADVASTTGLVTGNRFAIATNAIADLALAAGVLWSANATEAGWSTARPS